MNILFYTPFNARSRDTETLMQAFIAKGHAVYLLTQAPAGNYHIACKNMGVQVSAFPIEKKNAGIYFLRHAWHLLKFCKRNHIDIVYAHLETASLPAVLIQYFIKARVFACRHIIDEAYLLKSRNFILLNKIVYKLARNIIVVSQHSKDFMTQVEGIRASKIRVIYLAYNFDLYPSPDPNEVARIRMRYSSQLLLLTACRLVGPKRPGHAIAVVKNLVSRGWNVRLMLLGSGPDYDELKKLIANESLGDRVALLGYQSNVMDYISACDVLIHPSLLDASSVIVKEAGLQEKVVVACKGIGDVDEYLKDGENAFLVSSSNTIDQMTEAVEKFCVNGIDQEVGKKLRASVLARFSVGGIIIAYDEIHQDIEKDRL